MGSKKLYDTKQRNIILSFFNLHRNDCFSAKDIIQNSGCQIGEATVYRLLTKLTNEGKLKRFVADKGAGAMYKYNDIEQCGNHFHLKCIKCGDTICMNCSLMNKMGEHVESEHKFLMDNTKTIIFGTCKGCKYNS